MNEPLPELKFIKNPQRFKVAPTCPCGKDNHNNKFVPYEGYTDKGYCHSCGESFLPALPEIEGKKNKTPLKPKRKGCFKVSPKKEEAFAAIPFELFEKSVSPGNIQVARANSSLFQGLSGNTIANIPERKIIEAMSRFYIGYSGYRFSFSTSPGYTSAKGANVFWLLDENNNVRGGQVVLFNSESPTCSTSKNPERHTRPVYLAIESQFRRAGQPIPEWLRVYREQQGNKMPCLFGLPQLLKEPFAKPVAICEAPKTAIVGWLYFPEFIWLSVGSKGMLKAKRLKPLAGRNVTLFPDLSEDGVTFKLWEKESKNLQKELGGNWQTSRILEDAPDLTKAERKGGDIADYLLTRWDWQEFQEAKTNNNLTNLQLNYRGGNELQQIKEDALLPVKREEAEKKQRIAKDLEANLNDEPPPIVFEVEELESFFNSFIPPKSPVKLDSAMTVTDVSLFVKSHMATIKANQGRRSFKPYFDRLQLLREFLSHSNKN